jgi:hypothetical protein
VLPVEIGLQSLRVIGQVSLSAKEYHELRMDRIGDVPQSRFKGLEELEKEKIKIAKAYNKHVMVKSFQVGDLVWKTILPLGTQSGKFGKWWSCGKTDKKIIMLRRISGAKHMNS